MGEAKRNAAKRAEERRLQTEALRVEFLRQTENWSFPPSEWEARVVVSIQALPRVRVYRPSPEAAAYARMPARQCFENANWYAAQNPARSKAVVGWLEDDFGNYTLHAVIQLRDTGEWQDWTPVIGDDRPSYIFIPDPSIVQTTEELEDRVRYHHERDGQHINYGVRTDPERSLRHLAKVKADLLSGMDPIQAASQPYAE